jgi:hypothetical protein
LAVVLPRLVVAVKRDLQLGGGASNWAIRDRAFGLQTAGRRVNRSRPNPTYTFEPRGASVIFLEC